MGPTPTSASLIVPPRQHTVLTTARTSVPTWDNLVSGMDARIDIRHGVRQFGGQPPSALKTLKPATVATPHASPQFRTFGTAATVVPSMLPSRGCTSASTLCPCPAPYWAAA